jgi:hypothetical protein
LNPINHPHLRQLAGANRPTYFGFGVEAHADLVDALVYLILGLVQQGLQSPKIHWIEA